MEKYAAIILAAGKGTRMNEGVASPRPKVMYEIAGKPIIDWSVKLIRDAGIKKIVLVVGYKKEMIEGYFGDEVEYAVQQEQLGTGHAVAQAKELLRDKVESVIVFYGDNPLYESETVKKLVGLYENMPDGKKPTIAMLSVEFNDPVFWAFGRIIRDEEGEVVGIVEQKDCTPEQLKIKESNPGFYIFDAKWLWDNIEKLDAENAQREYYLTDMIMMAKRQNKRIVAMPTSHELEALGINNHDQQRQAEEILLERLK